MPPCDRIHLVLHTTDVGLDIGDVVLRRHVLHDVREHIGDLFEGDLLGHEEIVRAEPLSLSGPSVRNPSSRGNNRR